MDSDNLSALYALYQIDCRMYPPPNLRFSEIMHNTSCCSTDFYLQSSALQNYCQFGQHEKNNRERFRSWKKHRRQQQQQFNTRRTINNMGLEANGDHQQNMIVVRRMPSHETSNSQTIMKKSYDYNSTDLMNEKIMKTLNTSENKTTQSTNIVENQLQDCKIFSDIFNSSLTDVKLQTKPIQPSINKLLVSASSTRAQYEKKMPSSMSRSKLKDTYANHSSTSSLAFTQLLNKDNNQTKPDAANISGLQKDIETSALKIPSISSTNTASVVSHFLSPMTHHESKGVRSSTNNSLHVLQTESMIVPNLTNENIQTLFDQLNTCIDKLSRLIEKQIEHENYIIFDRKSYSNEKIMKSKTKRRQSTCSSISLRNYSQFSKQSILKKDDRSFQEITVRRCNSFNHEKCKKYEKQQWPSYDNQQQHEELQRCLLVYYHDRTNKYQCKNVNRIGREGFSSCA